MKALDFYIQKLRFVQAAEFIEPKSRLLDIGCHQGEFFQFLGPVVISGTGIDPLFEGELTSGPAGIDYIRDGFPSSKLTGKKFDVISILAVFEHVPQHGQYEFLQACYKLLDEGGKLIITVPSPVVDLIINALSFFRIIDGMSKEQHHGFKPREIFPLAIQAGFKLIIYRKFEFGLNHIFVFGRMADDS